MKIGIICPNFPPASFEGGISHYSYHLAKNLASIGHRVYAFTSEEFITSLNQDEENFRIERIFLKGPWGCMTVSHLRKLAKIKKIDCVILQFSPAAYSLGFRIAWSLVTFPCQKVTAFHTLWGKGLDRLFGFLCLISSKKIIATNSEIMAILEKRFSFLLKKTYWIPIWSNVLSEKKSTTKSQNVQPFISFFGMIYPGKGLDLILSILSKMKQTTPNFMFLFIGGGMLNHKSYEELFATKIEKLKLSSHVKFLGLVHEHEVSNLLNKSRFVFLPYENGLSDRRGSFMAALEHGKAVLTSPPIVEMPFLKNGENVMWPDRPTRKEYIALFEKLLTDGDLVQRLEKGAIRLSERFGWKKIASEYELALKES